MYTYGNRQSQDVPGPEALIILSHPENNTYTIPVAAIVDTGAIMTVVPASEILDLETNSQSCLEYRMQKFSTATGHNHELRVYRLHVTVTNIQGYIDYEDDVEVVSVSGKKYALIGRDILNKHKAVFNAKRQIKLWGFNCNEQNCTFS